MRDATGWVVAIGLLVVGAVQARAQEDEPLVDRREGWVGAWVVEGQAAVRHVFADGAALGVEAHLEGWRLDVRGGAGPGGFALRGEAARLVAGEEGGEAETGATERAALEAVGDGPDALRVELTLGAERRTERWRRLEAGRLDLRVLGVRPGPGGEVGVAPGQPLDLEVTVRGRPMPVVVLVLAAEGDARYERLNGIVAYDPLQDGATLPLGRRPVRWDGLDRTPLDGRPLAPGTYRIVAAPKDEVLAGAPGAPPSVAAAEVILVVRGPATSAPASPPAPPAAAPTPPAIEASAPPTRPREAEAQVRPFPGEGDTVHAKRGRGAAGQLPVGR